MKLRTKIMLLVFCVVAAILLLNQYPVSMSMRQSLLEAEGQAMTDIITLASISEEWVTSIKNADHDTLQKLSAELEQCRTCSGVAVVGTEFKLYYNSTENQIEADVISAYKASPPSKAEYYFVTHEDFPTVTYAYAPIHDENGATIGAIISKLINEENQSSIQKAQRDLNAMTLLVMLIALIFVWDLTDNITGTMFNLEPVEIAQLLVERNALIDAVRDCIISVNHEGQLVHINQSALKLFQHTTHNFNPKHCNFSDIFPEVSFQEILNENHPSYDNECIINAERFYANFIPIRIEKPYHESLLITFRPKQEVVRFAENITGVRSYIEALRAQMHEFNNKLQVMSGLVQGKKYSDLEDYLFSLVRLRNREMELVNKKIKDPILAAFLTSKFDRAAEQRVDLILTDRTELLTTLPDEVVQDMVVIIGNLLENAFAAVQGCNMQTVTLEMTETPREISLCVWNSGPEISPELREHLFEYGVTTKEDGNGIGLYLVQQACTRNNGYITLTSTPDDGTEFTVHLPITKNEENANVPSTDC